MLRIIQRRVPEGQHCIADVFVDGRLAGQQHVGQRRQQVDQKADQFLRPEPFGDAREVADVAEQDGHVPHLAAELELARVAGDAIDQFGRQITVEGVVDVAAGALLAIEGHRRDGDIDRHHADDRKGRLQQHAAVAKGEPRAGDDPDQGRRGDDPAAQRAQRRGRQGDDETEHHQQHALEAQRPVGPGQEPPEDHLLGRLGVD